ncbi:Trp biosynthesis-associated membrane protein [Microbacterium hominis]|uniref:Trp biosynthesis-associated membrane protein n=1 Tax=Microbacterium hominis TaxID=162426 RepID=A0A7D4PME5_9MICO|nr:Trp biosynthesis-associated membrane protein [Microbacterium hominis]QKJ19515.1 Trp biosynthesis-associated membrane protein [Microbacterium hominis]
MIRRARLLSVVAVVASGALGVISSTQVWLEVFLADGAAEPLAVPGADAVALLAPLSLAALALGGALSIVGLALRYAFGALSLVIGVTLLILTARVALEHPVDAVAGAVTAATGITGPAAVSELVLSISATPWPAVTAAVWVVLIAAGVFTLATARHWRGGDRRYRSEAPSAQPSGPAGSRPHDAIDSWDDLSRGDDPTA